MSTPPTSRPLTYYLQVLAAAGIVEEAPATELTQRLPIAFATDDSRQVQADTLFVCKGAQFKRDYLLQAREAGAIAYVATQDYSVDIPLIRVSDIRRALGVLALSYYNNPSAQLKIAAFTGTKGKTTCVYYLKHVLDYAADKHNQPPAGLFSTIEYFDGMQSGKSTLTTPEAFQLQKQLSNARDAGLTTVVMEASSQALKYERTYGMEFAVGAFTNIGEDHISPQEHPDFEDYFASKLKLFAQCKTAVVNLDMKHVERVLDAAGASSQLISYSLSNPKADVYVEKLSNTHEGMRARVHTPSFTRDMLIATPVVFNVSNALATIACALALGLGEAELVHAFETLRVPGRMELYPSADGRILGLVDYAHNGMSLSTLLSDLRNNYPDRELAVVFGATGGKGLDRRTTMGHAAGKLADRIIVTEDDPGPEDPADIADAIVSAIKTTGNQNYQVVLDRVDAIRRCVHETTRPAIVIVTGKGNDNYMLRHGVHEPWIPDGVHLAQALEEYAQGL
ncbi:UDP-N-acetylmuramoyl-L-alanyl-D-glutamate--2,6-diaminopimelate ligase [Collinsella sp. zg1085]|uniref:Mur ligase family protein n=1 Tax=Collinsella sp. zg1085 TaxID=2844380 RepID=UPI001C0C3CD7|nr:UDP-N-acetylmuramoyl-L-alanyl-D-glutamate--2,6-diaminopimelate ligase [Collinsella sp. zg1085]QWT17851.1 UDP-N-acetylmuramoyl-L-alanyl-D-glutamate--2,6-diaminopimelate ligase [Collinsella sp. zg1085]